MWNFAVISCDENDVTRWLGTFKTYEEALKFKEYIGPVDGLRLAIFDSGLKEVKKNPKASD